MASTQQSQNSPNVCYYDTFIRATLGRYLPECLQEVTEVKPADPIEYIANWLYKVNDSDMYYKAKVAYLREIHELGETLKREHKAHEEKVKPFLQAMQAERWNYFASLHAELEALEEVMAQVDTEVDEGTKLRFLEVQMLIKDEQDLVKGEYLTPLGGIRDSLKFEDEESEASKPLSLLSASVKHSSQAIEERKSVVMIEMPSSQEAESSRFARHRLPPVPRLERGSRRHSTQRRLSSAGILRAEPAQSEDTTRKSVGSDLVDGRDSDRRVRSSHSKDRKDGDVRQKGGPAEDSQVAETSFYRGVADESGSYVMHSTRSSEDSNDSETDQQEWSQEYETRQHRDAMSAKERCLDALMRYSKYDDSEIQLLDKDGTSVNDSLSATPRESRYIPSEDFRLPAMFPRGKHSQKVVPSFPGDRQQSLSKKSHRIKHGLPGQTHENADMDYQGDVDEVQEEADISRTHTMDDCGGFHLPPVRTQRDTSGVALSYEDGRLRKIHDRDVSTLLGSSDTVHLPPVATSQAATGTLIMTNSGHIAFVNQQLGVIASNSLKIRSVHPIDKPETWARRNFRPQSFYDHELYSETDHALVEGEDEDRWQSAMSTMALNEIMESPYRKWKKPKEDDSYDAL